MEEKLVILRKNRIKRNDIIILCSFLNISILTFIVLNLFFKFLPNITVFTVGFILTMASTLMIDKQEKDAQKERAQFCKEVVQMQEGLKQLLKNLETKSEELKNLDVSKFETKDDLIKEFVPYYEYVFTEVLQKMVDITGVAPNLILLPMNTKEDVEAAFYMAKEMLNVTLESLQRTEKKLKA